ncbi:MAG: hypothetical protein IJY56_04725 [Clostridia bacterium]|nr:hypothetical protein [Clostridia bacterium]
MTENKSAEITNEPKKESKFRAFFRYHLEWHPIRFCICFVLVAVIALIPIAMVVSTPFVAYGFPNPKKFKPNMAFDKWDMMRLTELRVSYTGNSLGIEGHSGEAIDLPTVYITDQEFVKSWAKATVTANSAGYKTSSGKLEITVKCMRGEEVVRTMQIVHRSFVSVRIGEADCGYIVGGGGYNFCADLNRELRAEFINQLEKASEEWKEYLPILIDDKAAKDIYNGVTTF